MFVLPYLLINIVDTECCLHHVATEAIQKENTFKAIICEDWKKLGRYKDDSHLLKGYIYFKSSIKATAIRAIVVSKANTVQHFNRIACFQNPLKKLVPLFLETETPVDVFWLCSCLNHGA